jgi:hypothetical protein
MVFTLRLRPKGRGYDFEKICRTLTELELGTYNEMRQSQTMPAPFGEDTLLFRRKSVELILRAEDPAPALRQVYLAAYAASGAASGVPPSFEVTHYDFRGSPNRSTINEIFRAVVDGDVVEAARLWGREKGRMFRAFLAHRDLEERIREEGPDAVFLELEANEPEEAAL